jgi:type IV secretion system protein VirB11
VKPGAAHAGSLEHDARHHASDHANYDFHALPLAPFLARDDVSEITINRPFEVAVETRNGWEFFEVPEFSYDWLISLAKLSAALTKQDVNDVSGVCSSVLPGGERVQIVIPPSVEAGTVSITIRKASKTDMDIDDFAGAGLFNEVRGFGDGRSGDDELLALRAQNDWPGFFRTAVKARKNILISGATGSGKTSLSKALIKLIPDYERVLTIEDTRELVVGHRNRVHMMYSKDAKSKSKVGAKQLLESALRMRPDRILLQELRDEVAFFYLRNVNSGHPGSITTAHANTAKGALEQLTLLVKESDAGKNLAREDIRAMLHSLIDIVVQMYKFPPENGMPARYRMTEVWLIPDL